MKVTAQLGLASLGLLPFTTASSLGSRALPNAPNGYAPAQVSCPSTRPTIRNATTLSSQETSWLETRRNKTAANLQDFFSRIEIDSFDAVSYLQNQSSDSSNLPNVAIAISGGGLTAAMNGAGAIKAFDNRTEGSTATGQLGGLLQSATYVSALSGGSWMLSSVYINNFTTISALQESVWNFDSATFFEGPSTMDTTDFWGNITTQVRAKADAGFPVTEPDIWGRIQGYYFLNASHGGVDYTWSSIADIQAFQDADMPLPLVVLGGQSFANVTDDPTLTEPTYEVTPWEFGTYTYSVYGFAPLEYLGTRFVNGSVPDNETCVRGFDNAGFITGSSSDIWNTEDMVALIDEESAGVSSTEAAELDGIIEEIEYALNATNTTLLGAAAYEPNAFYGWNADTSPFAADERLTIVDGGKNGANVPFDPVILREREVDVIFAVDSIITTGNYWPDGASLIDTYERTLDGVTNSSFPSIPDNNTIANLGLNAGPTFFGCNASNFTTPTPLVVYLPNHPVTYMSNVSEYSTTFNTSARDDMITNGYNVVTQANGTLDSNWTTCVGCAILSRSFDRTGTEVPEACSQCFERYCWNGTLDDVTPSSPYEPSLALPDGATNGTNSTTTSGAGSSFGPAAWSAMGVVGLTLLVV